MCWVWRLNKKPPELLAENRGVNRKLANQNPAPQHDSTVRPDKGNGGSWREKISAWCETRLPTIRACRSDGFSVAITFSASWKAKVMSIASVCFAPW